MGAQVSVCCPGSTTDRIVERDYGGFQVWKSEDARANGLDCCNYDQIMISESYVVERYDRKLRLKYLDGTEKSPSRRRKTDVL